MSRYLKTGFLTVFLFSITGHSFAEAWEFSGGVGVKYQTLDFEVAGSAFKPLFVSNTISFTGVKDNIYLSLEYDISTKDHQELFTNADEVQFVDMSRSDTNFTFGYLLGNSVSFFVGYKQANLDIKVDTVILPNGGAGGDNSPRAQDVEFRDSGFYVGTNYVQNFTGTGTLSYSAAYAQLDGEVLSRFAAYDFVSNSLVVVNSKTEGATSGVSLGVSWNDSFSETSTYYMALKANLYEFEDEAKSVGFDLSTDETFTILSIGLRKYF